MSENRSPVLDAWDYRAPFARYHITWTDGADVQPAFPQGQALAILQQELGLTGGVLELLGHREVLALVSSEHLDWSQVPAWVVIIAGRKQGEAEALKPIAPGAGLVLQALVHARTGEVLLGTALPVRFQHSS